MQPAIDVYRLEEDGSLLQEGGGGLPLGALRACLLKDPSGRLTTGALPPHTLQGVYHGFCNA